MSAALRLVHLHGLTLDTLKASEAVRQLHRADPAMVASLHRAYEAISVLRYQGRLDEAALARKLTNRLYEAAVLQRKLEPLHIVHSGIMRAAWGEHAKVLAAVERLAEEG